LEEPGREHEPILASDQIQGNIFPGFSKDFQTLLFLRITNAARFALWLGEFIPRIATLGRVLGFNRLFKAIRSEQKAETGTVKATWINIAFSFAGLKKLETPSLKLDDFADEAFKSGLLRRSREGLLGDPVGTGTPGDPQNWIIGGPDNEPDVVLLLAGDERDDLDREVARVVQTLFPRSDASGQVAVSGVQVLTRQDGATLTGPLRGYEHFGFRDGISQPGIRGKLPDGSFLTPGQNPKNVDQGKPGQDLLWPGEFVFGYPGQDPNAEVKDPGKNPLRHPTRKAPEFARNGSFVVFRRLRQHVGMFHRFLQSVATRFQVSPEFVGAQMVGRWPSGAPTVITPDVDDAILADDDCKNNNFEFGKADEGDASSAREPRPGDCPGVTDPPNDPDAAKLPFAGHIRKSYPRNDTSPDIPQLKESTTQTHRLLRRGIPYGEQSASSPHQPLDDNVDRGLLFLAYQVSIVEQFEFVTQTWVNNPNFKQSGVGFDPIIGQNAAPNENRSRSFRLSLPGETQPITTDQDWVVPTGGGYFFTPCVDALWLLAGAESQRERQAEAANEKTTARAKTAKKRG